MIWFTSDLHLNHRNIIGYCNRPFSSVKEMNEVLIRNWNNAVGEGDIVFFLGDLTLERNPTYWLELLNGRIILIRGSHDKFTARRSFVLHHKGIDMFLVHNPEHAPLDWDGWVIHGHKHNTAPLIDPVRKRVNVSVEVTGYKPINLNRVAAMISGTGKIVHPSYPPRTDMALHGKIKEGLVVPRL